VQAMTDVVGGQIDGYMSSVSAANPYIRMGKVRALAVASTGRIPQLPDVPTTAEAGIKGFVAGAWWGILAPAGLPAPLQVELNTEVNNVLRMPDVRAKISADGSVVLGGTPQQLTQRLKSESEKWGRIVRAANIKVD
jgi:tripartite-type tricarboxylate transporter receptor subunit TctC